MKRQHTSAGAFAKQCLELGPQQCLGGHVHAHSTGRQCTGLLAVMCLQGTAGIGILASMQDPRRKGLPVATSIPTGRLRVSSLGGDLNVPSFPISGDVSKRVGVNSSKSTHITT